MRDFKDSNGLTWTIRVNVNVIEAVKQSLGVDIADLYMETGTRVFSDPVLTVNVLYVCCQAEAEKRGITDVQFGESMIGDAIENGVMSLMAAVRDFFPTRKHALMNAQLAKAKQISEAAITRATAAVESLTPEAYFASQKN